MIGKPGTIFTRTLVTKEFLLNNLNYYHKEDYKNGFTCKIKAPYLSEGYFYLNNNMSNMLGKTIQFENRGESDIYWDVPQDWCWIPELFVGETEERDKPLFANFTKNGFILKNRDI